MVTPRITKTCKVCGLAMQSVFPETLFNCHPDQTNPNDTQDEAERLAWEYANQIISMEKELGADKSHALIGKLAFTAGYRAGQASRPETSCPQCGYGGCIRGRKACDTQIDELGARVDKLTKENDFLRTKPGSYFIREWEERSAKVNELAGIISTLTEENERLKTEVNTHYQEMKSTRGLAEGQVYKLTSELTAEKAKAQKLVDEIIIAMPILESDGSTWGALRKALSAYHSTDSGDGAV